MIINQLNDLIDKGEFDYKKFASTIYWIRGYEIGKDAGVFCVCFEVLFNVVLRVLFNDWKGFI